MLTWTKAASSQKEEEEQLNISLFSIKGSRTRGQKHVDFQTDRKWVGSTHPALMLWLLWLAFEFKKKKKDLTSVLERITALPAA